MPTIITNANSYFGAGKAFTGVANDTLTVNAGAYLISTDTDAVDLDGIWTVKVNGYLGGHPTTGARGLVLNAVGAQTKISNVTVGADGEIGGGTSHGIFSAQAANITIAKGGAVTSQSAPTIRYTNDAIGNYKITNAGIIEGVGEGIILGGIGIHTVTNSGTINGTDAILDNNGLGNNLITNTGSILGDITLNAGNDSVTNSKLVVGRIDMGDGADTVTNSGTITGTVSLEGGNDVFKNTGTVQGDIDMGAGDDQFFGGAKDEFIGDQDGADKYMLGGGNDFYFARGDFGTNDTADGGAGIDIYDASNATDITTINLDTVFHAGQFNGKQVGQGGGGLGKQAASGELGTDTITGFEDAWGGSNTDFIFGNNSANEIFGFKGNDDLWGYGGNDKLEGGEGNDNLIGGAGRDVLTGDAGNDNFIFLTLAEIGKTASTRDIIIDFIAGAGVDKIDLSHIDGDTRPSMPGDSPFTGFVALDNGFSAFTKAAGELRQFWANGSTIIEGDVNGDGKADFQIELLGRHILTDTDFIL